MSVVGVVIPAMMWSSTPDQARGMRAPGRGGLQAKRTRARAFVLVTRAPAVRFWGFQTLSI